MLGLVDAAKSAGVQRFVYISFPPEDAIRAPMDRAKLAVEKRLGTSSMRTVILRSDAFQEIHLAPIGRFDMAAGKVSVIGHGDTPRRWIATDDVAALLAAVAVEPDPPAMLTVGGPERMTKNEAIALAEQLTHRKMKVQRMPRPVARVAIRVLAKRYDALATAFGARSTCSPAVTVEAGQLAAEGRAPRRMDSGSCGRCCWSVAVSRCTGSKRQHATPLHGYAKHRLGPGVDRSG